jgi:hypothetical protein
MKKINPIHAALFIIGLAIVTSSILWVAQRAKAASAQRATQAQQTATEKARVQRVAGDEAAEHEKYLARYVRTKFVRKPGVETVAMIIAAEDESFSAALDALLTDRFKSASVEIIPGLFTPAFVSDGFFKEAFHGSPEVFQKLELGNSLDSVVLVQPTINYVSNPSLNNTITAQLRTEIVALPVAAKRKKQGWSYLASGIGFTKDAARQSAQEHILDQLANDTTVSFHQITQNKQ